MNKLLQILTNNKNTTYTANGAKTLATTGSKVLDLFSRGAAMRQNQAGIPALFLDAWNEDKALALKAMFYISDIRGGQMERDFAKTTLKTLAQKDPELVKEFLPLYPFYTRWDNVFVLLDIPATKDFTLDFITKQLNKDIQALNNGDNVSLLGKWCSSENTSSSETRRIGTMIREHLGVSPKQYRQTLTALRAKIGIVEAKMSSDNWADINFEQVPSRASMIYRKAFSRHQPERYVSYLESVKKGEAKINTSTLYPYDIVGKVLDGTYDTTLQLQWDNLPNYINEANQNSIVVADVSGSMSGNPMKVCLSLAIYFAEKAKGVFKDHFITFSTTPTLEKLVGHNLQQKVQNLSRAHWAMSTNLQSVFDLILNAAITNKLTDADIPKSLIIVSDMEFNVACSHNNKTNFEVMRDKFKKHNLTLPTIVFWNVNATSQQSPVTKDERGAVLVSGCSPVVFKAFLERKEITPFDAMLEVLNSPRYDLISQLNKLNGVRPEKKKVVPRIKNIKISRTIKTQSKKTTKNNRKTVKR